MDKDGRRSDGVKRPTCFTTQISTKQSQALTFKIRADLNTYVGINGRKGLSVL